MSQATKGQVIDELSLGTTVVSAVPCGLVSVILVGVSLVASTIKLYDNAAAAEGTVKKQLKVGTLQEVAVYCPCKPDAFSNGIVAVVSSDAAKAYVSIE